MMRSWFSGATLALFVSLLFAAYPMRVQAGPLPDVTISTDYPSITVQAGKNVKFPVRFTNNGTNPHSVLSDTGAFDSGRIPPGGVWIFEADRPGKYNYSDGGRPFAVGLIEVS